MVPLREQYRSFHLLSTPEVQREPVRSFPEHLQLVLHQPDQTVHWCFVRNDVVLTFHPVDHWPES